MDLTNQVERLELQERQFTPEGENRKVNYDKLVLFLNVKGEIVELPLDHKINSTAKALLKLATTE